MAGDSTRLDPDWEAQLQPPRRAPLDWTSGVAPAGAEASPLIDLGVYVRRSRSFLWWGQRRLAARSCASQSSIARLELGRAPGLRLETFVSISEALGRGFPLGTCPHKHRCAWQPIKHPEPFTDSDRFREEWIRLGLDNPRHSDW